MTFENLVNIKSDLLLILIWSPS